VAELRESNTQPTRNAFRPSATPLPHVRYQLGQSCVSRPSERPVPVRLKDLPMSSILVINAAGRETRVALVENGHIAEFYLERKKDKGIVGNIYKGA